MRGAVRCWVAEKGFGFIRPDNYPMTQDVFVHFRRLEDGRGALEPGTEVEFDVETNPRNGRLRATRVRIVG